MTNRGPFIQSYQTYLIKSKLIEETQTARNSIAPETVVVCEFFPLPRNFPGALEKKFFYCASSSPPLSFLLCAQQNYVFTLKFKQQTLVFLLGLCFAAVVYLNTVNIFTAEKAPRRGKNLELQSAAVAAAPLLL